MALIRAHHAVFGVCMVPDTRVALHPQDWTPIDGDPAQPHAPDFATAGEVPQTPAADGAGTPTTQRPAGDDPGQNQED